MKHPKSACPTKFNDWAPLSLSLSRPLIHEPMHVIGPPPHPMSLHFYHHRYLLIQCKGAGGGGGGVAGGRVDAVGERGEAYRHGRAARSNNHSPGPSCFRMANNATGGRQSAPAARPRLLYTAITRAKYSIIHRPHTHSKETHVHTHAKI